MKIRKCAAAAIAIDSFTVSYYYFMDGCSSMN